MTPRLGAVVAWLLTFSMNGLWIWALVSGRFMDSMQAFLTAEEQQAAQATIVVTYLAMVGIVAVTLAYATVGLLLAWRPGGGRVGAILLAGGVVFTAVPFGYIVGGVMVLENPPRPSRKRPVPDRPGDLRPRILDDPPARGAHVS